jgi:hypothetical protein
MENFLTEITWFLIGYASGCVTFLVLIFWTDIVHKFSDFFTFRKLKYKLKMIWWEVEFFIKYKVLRK